MFSTYRESQLYTYNAMFKWAITTDKLSSCIAKYVLPRNAIRT